MLTEPANFITSDMLKLPKGSLLARYLNIFLIFGLSGVLHSIAGISSKMPLTEYGVLRFFCTQTLGIIIEDGFQALFNRFGGMNSTGRPTSTLTRCVGYSWVYVFLIWTTPSWLYPQASRPTVPGSRDILPYSILRALRS